MVNFSKDLYLVRSEVILIYYKTFSSLFADGSASNNKETYKPNTGFGAKPEGPAGFVSVDDFRNSFAALASNDFGEKDYFEQSQRQTPNSESEDAEKDSYESKPGPSYTANRTPAQFAYENRGHKKGVATEVHDLTEKPPNARAPKKYKKPESAESNESSSSGEYNEDGSYAYPSAESYYQPSAPTPTGKVADYNTGKSSSTVSQNPYAQGYYSKPSAAPNPSLSPYDKYSFQPASSDYIGSVLSTSAPYKKTDSGSIPSVPTDDEKALASNKNCKKVGKQIKSKDAQTGRYKRQSMDCFICQDPTTKSNFEQCTYTADSVPKNYYASASNSYSATIPDTIRYKRYSGGDSQVDPYELVKHQKYQSRPKSFDSKHYQPTKDDTAETNQDYRYTPTNYKKEEPKKSFSEQKADELIQKGGDNCEKVQREEMSCVVCTSSETGGNYEQCSYSSAPAQQKYAYVREQKFDGPVPDKSPEASHTSSSKSPQHGENTKQETKTDDKPRYSYQSDFHRGREEPLPHYRSRDEEQKGSEKSEKKENVNTQNKQKENNRGSTRYQIPSHFEYETSNTNNKKTGGRGLDPRLYGGDEEEETEATQNEKKEEKKEKKDDDEYEFPAIGEYKFKYFPDFLKEESETAESKIVAEPAKKDVEEVLAEFAKKDRSNCQKAEKNGMTCYLCTDKNGLQHEECMYISESVPKQSHVAYHEKQEVQSKPAAENNQAQPAPQKQQAPSEPAPAASEQIIQKIKYKATGEEAAASNTNGKSQKAPAKAREDEEEAEASEKSTDEKEDNEDSKNKGKQKEEEDDKITDVPEPPTPEEFKVGEKEGAYSDETRPVFSKALGVTLPKYMLTKSESEAIFDEFVSSS